jgi:hypothetical protein
MSAWEDLELERRIAQVLEDVPTVNDSHHFGRPFLSAYQIAIELEARDPGLLGAINMDSGGRGSGHRSLAQ